jgi:protein TonB
MVFEGVLGHRDRRPTLRKRVALTASAALHATALAVGIVYSFWHVEELSPPALAVTLHLGVVPPPPPPPPPKKSTNKPKTKPGLKSETLIQPKAQQVRPEPEEKPNETEESDEGVVGGEAGGVKGGVIGGVIGGVPPPPPPKDTGPKILPPQLARGLLLIDPSLEQYRVKVPPAMESLQFNFTARLRICVSELGAVTQVQVLKGADPAIDPQFPRVIGRWRYRPYTVDGRPVPWCTLLDYQFSQR